MTPNPLPPPLPDFPSPWPQDRLLDPTRRSSDDDFLAQIQGNILQGHGRDFAAVIFWRCQQGGRRDPSFWTQVAGKVTTARMQRRQAAEKLASPNSVLISLALTAAGMAALEVADDANHALLKNPESVDAFAAFNTGAAAALGNKPPPEQAPDWARQELHGLWLVACGCPKTLAAEIETLRALGEANGLITTDADIEPLKTWRRPPTDPTAGKKGAPAEPFGFADGISVPSFFEGDRAKRELGGPWMEMPLEQVLIGPGISLNDRHLGGSFFALQKLEQNVAAFRAFETEIAPQLKKAGLPKDVCAEPGALLIGRFRDGRPLVPLDAARGVTKLLNAFSFEKSGAGRCPFHAHIRKLNPRTEAPLDDKAPSGQEIRRTQFVRRGMVYDPQDRLTDRAPFPEAGVGLMFIAYTSNLRSTFEKMADNWTRDEYIPARSGKDPLLAGSGEPWTWEQHGITSKDLARFVTFLGGGYFYVPPIRWLREQGNAIGAPALP